MSDPQLSPEIVAYIDNLQKQVDVTKTENLSLKNSIGQGSLLGGEKDKNIVELQLDIQKMKDEIYHLLSGHEVKTNEETGSEYWAEPEDDRLKTFSNFGIKQVMNIFSMYININTLMSWYDDTTIKWKVKDFGIELSDLFLNKYETLLSYPSPEELYEKYLPITKEKKLDITPQELYNKCVQWSEEELAAKENLLTIICWSLINMVHSAYLRAFQGKERQSIGERGINISQSNLGNDLMLPQQKKPGLFGVFK